MAANRSNRYHSGVLKIIDDIEKVAQPSNVQN